MGEVELVNALRKLAVSAVSSNTKPMTIQIGEYLGDNMIHLSSGLDVEAFIPAIFTTGVTATIEGIEVHEPAAHVQIHLEAGDKVIVIKQDGAYQYYVLDKI